MGWKATILGISASLAIAALSAAPASACPCPKQKMIEMYGTAAAYGPKVAPAQKPAREPAAITVSDLADAHGGKDPVTTSTPASDQVTASFQQILAAAPY